MRKINKIEKYIIRLMGERERKRGEEGEREKEAREDRERARCVVKLVFFGVGVGFNLCKFWFL